MPSEVAKAVQEMTAEYEANEMPEARMAHDANRCETLLQAMEYQAQGYDAQAWCDTSIAAAHRCGLRLAQAMAAADPHGW